MRRSTYLAAALFGAAAAFSAWDRAEDAADVALERPFTAVPAGAHTRLVPGAEYRSTRLSTRDDVREALRPTADDAELRRARFEVTGTRGEPVASARIEWERGASRTVYTDAAGRASSTVPPDGATASEAAARPRVRITAEGYRATVVELDAIATTDDGAHLVRLDDGGVLAGVVTRSNGVAAPAGTSVLAWPAGSTPDVDAIVRVRDGGLASGLLVAETDRFGRFRFEGVGLGERYDLTAARSGEVALERARRADAGRTDLELVVKPLVAAAVRLVDADGGAPRAGEGLFAGGSVWDPVENGLHTRHLPADGVEAAWIGGASLWEVAQGGRDDYLMVYEPHETALAGPMNGTLSLTVPGYRPVWTSVPLARFDADLAVRELPLQRAVEHFGAVDVEWIGAEGWVESAGNGGRASIGALRLEPVDGGEPLMHALAPTPEGAWTIDGVPCGRYRAVVQLRDWSGAIDGATSHVEVTPDGAYLAVDLRERGAGEVVVELADGRDYDGELVLLVRKGSGIDGGQARFVRFDGAPYVLAGLEEGEYEVSVQSVGGAPADGTPGSRMWLAANTVTACLIQFR